MSKQARREPLTGAVCNRCRRALVPAAAMADGQPTTVGYLPCPKHPRAGCQYIPRSAWREILEEQRKESAR